MRSLHAICFDIIDIGSFRKVYISKSSLFISSNNETTILEAGKSTKSTIELVVVKVADFGF